MCDEWKESFINFREWAIESGYYETDGRNKECTIERIDVNGNYEPSNCRWANMREQSNNKTCNHMIEYNGEKHTLSEWSEITGIPYCTLYRRIIKEKLDIKNSLTKNSNSHRYITYNGETKTVSEWAEITGIHRKTITSRIDKYNMPIDKVFEKKETRHLITYMGETKTVYKWAETIGMNPITLYARINRSKMTAEKAIETEIDKSKIRNRSKTDLEQNV